MFSCLRIALRHNGFVLARANREPFDRPRQRHLCKQKTGLPAETLARQSSAGNSFSGDIAWVQLAIGDDSHDHLIKPEDLIHAAMVKQ